MRKQPNLLVILTDQQNANMLGAAGNPYVQTPAMDALAADGVRFERATCTNPVCVASRFSILTGRRPSAIGLFSNATDRLGEIPEAIRRAGLGRVLRSAGYRTGYAGKVHAPKMSAEELGFEWLECDGRDGVADACRGFLDRKGDAPFLFVASFVNPHDICYMAIRDAASTGAERRTVERGADACRTLDRALARPDAVSETEFFERWCPPLPPNFEVAPDEPEALQALLVRRPFRMHARREWTERRWREHRWAYARLTGQVDAEIGLLLDAVREAGAWDDTVVVLTSDHGDMDAAFRMEHKSTLYNEACRVPLVIRDPAAPIRGSAVRDYLVCNGEDLLPTLCEYAGVAAPEGGAGFSLRPFLRGIAPSARREAVPIECVIGRAVCTRRYKYARYEFGGRNEQLFDLDADPAETNNVIRDPAYAAPAAELRRVFDRLHPPRPVDMDRMFEEMLNA